MRRSLGELEAVGVIAIDRGSDVLSYTLAVPFFCHTTSWNIPSTDKSSGSKGENLTSGEADRFAPDSDAETEGSNRSTHAPEERYVAPEAGEEVMPQLRISPKQHAMGYGLGRPFCREHDAERIGLKLEYVGQVFSRLLAEGHNSDRLTAKARSAAQTTYAAHSDGLVDEICCYWAAVLDEKLVDGLTVAARVMANRENSSKLKAKMAASMRSAGGDR